MLDNQLAYDFFLTCVLVFIALLIRMKGFDTAKKKLSLSGSFQNK